MFISLRSRIVFGIGLCLLWLTAGSFSPVQADGQTVVINELMWMGSSASSADEWIELRNLTDAPIDLSGWQLMKKSNGVEVAMLTIPTGKTLPASGYFLISNYVNTNSSSVLNNVPDYVNTDVALSNTALQIKLYNASHVVLDTADDGVGNPLSGVFDSTAKVYSSMERNPVPGDGTLAQNWHAASRGVGFKADHAEKGTPNTANSNGLPTAAAGPDQSGIVGQALNFDGTDSNDPEGQSLTYHWDFGDSVTIDEPTPRHSFTVAGTYTVQLAVNDGVDNATDSLTVTVQTGTIPVDPMPAPSTDPVHPATAPVTSCRGVLLNELFPNPVGKDDGEFIELFNPTTSDITLSGCAIWTSATREYSFPPNTTVPAGEFFVLQKSVSHLSLVNTGATIRLVDSDGTEIDRVEYHQSVEGSSWSNFAGTWSWTNQVTPAAANHQQVDPVEPDAVEPDTNTPEVVTEKVSPPDVPPTAAKASSCRGLIISELYPNPPGLDNDEFIELVNTGGQEVNTAGCLVATTATRKFKLPDHSVPTGGYYALPKSLTHLILANTQGTVMLGDGDGIELDRVKYTKALEAQSWALIADEWKWTATTTPGAANIFSMPESKQNKASTKSKTVKAKTAKKSGKAETPAQAVAIAQVQELDSGDRVIVSGIVTSPVGALGATLTYIENDGAGVSLSIPNGEPSVKVGNEVEATGTVRLKQGRRYIAVKTQGLKITTATTDIEPATVSTDDVGVEQADQLVHVKGVVALASGNRIEIDDGSGPIPIYLKSSTGIVRPKVKPGDTIEATGIVSISTSGVRVLPRSQEDLHVEKVLGASTTTAPQATIIPPSSSQQSLWYWVLAGVGGLGAAVRPGIEAWKRRGIKIKG